MRNATLETVFTAWQSATTEQQEAAITALKGKTNTTIKTPSIIRWVDLAERLQVTKKTALTATQRAGITPVILPGRVRSIGIRTADLWKLEGGKNAM